MQTISTRDVSCELHHFLMEFSQAEDNISISRLYHRFASGFAHSRQKRFYLENSSLPHTLLENSSLYSYTVRKQFPLLIHCQKIVPFLIYFQKIVPFLIHCQKIVPFTHTRLENSSLYSYTVRKQFPSSYTSRKQFPLRIHGQKIVSFPTHCLKYILTFYTVR